MKVFLDTSVLIAAVLEQHGDHARAFAILERVQQGKDEGVVAAHSLAEAYAILTRLPSPFRHSPEEALLSIEENILKHFTTSSLSGADYASLIRDVASRGVQGGTIYDAVLLKSAVKASVTRIFTLNIKHFRAIAPQDVSGMIAGP
jgi:predicted nucleic acid-binding protein